MINYLQKFLCKLSEQTKLIRNLHKKGVHFAWAAEHQACFEIIRSLVSESMTLAHYDHTKHDVLQTDYSEAGADRGVVKLVNSQP